MLPSIIQESGAAGIAQIAGFRPGRIGGFEPGRLGRGCCGRTTDLGNGTDLGWLLQPATVAGADYGEMAIYQLARRNHAAGCANCPWEERSTLGYNCQG